MGKRQRMENTVSPEFDGVLRVSIRQPGRLIDSVNVPIRIGKVRYNNEKSTDVPQYSFILPFKGYKKDLSMTVTVLQPCSHTDISKFNRIKIAMTANWHQSDYGVFVIAYHCRCLHTIASITLVISSIPRNPPTLRNSSTTASGCRTPCSATGEDTGSITTRSAP